MAAGKVENKADCATSGARPTRNERGFGQHSCASLSVGSWPGTQDIWVNVLLSIVNDKFR
jgi:hypothetical protein